MGRLLTWRARTLAGDMSVLVVVAVIFEACVYEWWLRGDEAKEEESWGGWADGWVARIRRISGL